jgi:hypothetical protein
MKKQNAISIQVRQTGGTGPAGARADFRPANGTTAHALKAQKAFPVTAVHCAGNAA